MSINLKKLEMTLVENRYNQSCVIDNKDGLALVAELREARKRIAELEAENAKLRADAGRYVWLRENAGMWSVNPDPIEWISADGAKYRPKISFSAKGVAYFGMPLCEAIDAAKEQQ